MTEIKRYEMEKEYSLDINVIPVEEHDGSFVRYDDHAAIVAALKEQVQKLAAENFSLKDSIIGIESITDKYAVKGMSSIREIIDSCRPMTATDAFIREIRAQGVDDVAMRFHESAFVAFEYIDETGPFIRADLQQYAARIRSGEQP